MQKFINTDKIFTISEHITIKYSLEEEVKLILFSDNIEAAYLTIELKNTVISYDSWTEAIFEGKGYNTLLRKHFHSELEGTGLTLENCAINPISDHLLRKFGVPRTEVFENFLKENPNMCYETAALSIDGPTHRKYFPKN